MSYRQGAPISVGNLTLPNITTHAISPPAPVNGQVTCSLHRKTRAMKFVQVKTITDAEGAVVGYTYHCTESSPCIVGERQQHLQKVQAEAIAAATGDPTGLEAKNEDGSGSDDDFDIDEPSQKSNDGHPPSSAMKRLGYDGVRITTTGSDSVGLGGLLAQAGGEVPKGLFGDSSSPLTSPTTPGDVAGARFSVGTGNAAGRPANRYYDMSKKRDDSDFKKVCWSCGMDTHEKPQCPNLLCRNCHDKQEAGYEGRMSHRCSRVGLSAFVLLDTDLLDTFMAAEELTKHNKKVASADTAKKSARSSLLTFDDAAFVNPALMTTRCPRCNQMGHMDCPHPLSTHRIERDRQTIKAGKKPAAADEGMARKLSCCGCAASDHSGYECPSRPRDYWRERVLGAAVAQLGLDDVKELVAIDERVPTSFNPNTVDNYNGGSNAVRTNAANFGKRDREDEWSDAEGERSQARRSRGEYDSSYNRSGRRGDSLSYSDSDDDDRRRSGKAGNGYSRGGDDRRGQYQRDDRHQGTFAMGTNAVRNHAHHGGRIESNQQYSRPQPQGSSNYQQQQQQQQQQGHRGYASNNHSGYQQQHQQSHAGYSSQGNNSNSNYSRQNSGSSFGQQSGGYGNNNNNNNNSSQGSGYNSSQGRAGGGGGYQRPLPAAQQQQQHRGGGYTSGSNSQPSSPAYANNYRGGNQNNNSSAYTNRANVPPANRTGQYNKRGYEF